MLPASELLEALGRALRGRSDVRLALLFGSRARGTAHATSDVDLAFEGSADPLELAAELSLACGLDVDVVALADPGYPLLTALARDAVVVHEGVSGAAARWRGRALTTLETDRPWYERMRDAYLQKLAAG